VGVAPPGFFAIDPAAAPDFYIPLHTNLKSEPAQYHKAFGAGCQPRDFSGWRSRNKRETGHPKQASCCAYPPRQGYVQTVSGKVVHVSNKLEVK